MCTKRFTNTTYYKKNLNHNLNAAVETLTHPLFLKITPSSHLVFMFISENVNNLFRHSQVSCYKSFANKPLIFSEETLSKYGTFPNFQDFQMEAECQKEPYTRVPQMTSQTSNSKAQRKKQLLRTEFGTFVDRGVVDGEFIATHQRQFNQR